MVRRFGILLIVVLVPIIFGVVLGEIAWGIAATVVFAVLGLPAVVLDARRDTRLSLKAFFLMNRSSGGGP